MPNAESPNHIENHESLSASEAVISELRNRPEIMDKLVAPALRSAPEDGIDISVGELLGRVYGIGRDKDSVGHISKEIGINYSSVFRRASLLLEYSRRVFLSDNPATQEAICEGSKSTEDWIYNAWQVKELLQAGTENPDLERFLNLPITSSATPPKIVFEQPQKFLAEDPKGNHGLETVKSLLLRRFGSRSVAADTGIQYPRQSIEEIAELLGHKQKTNTDIFIDAIMMAANSKFNFSFRVTDESKNNQVFSRAESILTRYEMNFSHIDQTNLAINPTIVDGWMAHGIHYGFNTAVIGELMNKVSLSVNKYGAEPFNEKTTAALSASMRNVSAVKNRHIASDELTVEIMGQRNKWEAAAQIHSGIQNGTHINRRLFFIEQLMNGRNDLKPLKEIGEELGVPEDLLKATESAIRIELDSTEDGHFFLSRLYESMKVDGWEKLDSKARVRAMADILPYYLDWSAQYVLSPMEDSILSKIASGKSYEAISAELKMKNSEVGSILSSHLYGIVRVKNRSNQEIHTEYVFLEQQLNSMPDRHDLFIQHYQSVDDPNYIADMEVLRQLNEGRLIKDIQGITVASVSQSLGRIRSAIYNKPPHFFAGGWS